MPEPERLILSPDDYEPMDPKLVRETAEAIVRNLAVLAPSGREKP